ncbi:MAG: hypothetical protein GYA23_11465 [Methanomicrobiales archaeon]|nr:hypothetical protein [Methanomicrobiales archaeon]
MKEDTRWKLLAGIILVTLSLALFTVHYLIFHDAHHVLIYAMGDLAFIPIEVLVVTLIIDQMLASREKQQRMEKLNMVIGTFYSTLGTPLLALLARADPGLSSVRPALAHGAPVSDEAVAKMNACLSSHPCTVRADSMDLEALRTLLVSNDEFLLRIIENPMVFEHESFTDLILAVTHLEEELRARDHLTSLPPTDLAHLQGDMNRVYSHLVPEWVRYMQYLKKHYPFLFSLALRRNPFDPDATVFVEN